MKHFILTMSLSLFTGPVFADPQCTSEPKDKWKDQKAFEQSLKDQGYKIKKFKVTETNCYEIYGWDRAGKKVEIYYNPVTGEVVKDASPQ
jgi:hypothetical protein